MIQQINLEFENSQTEINFTDMMYLDIEQNHTTCKVCKWNDIHFEVSKIAITVYISLKGLIKLCH